MASKTVSLPSGIHFANDRPFVLIGGMNVIESEELLIEVAEKFVGVTRELAIPFVFKASFDKANRSVDPLLPRARHGSGPGHAPEPQATARDSDPD